MIMTSSFNTFVNVHVSVSLGKILYKHLGCWTENERLQSLISLEGTDDLLMDSYKSRRDAIAKCATVARKRNFTGLITFCK